MEFSGKVLEWVAALLQGIFPNNHDEALVAQYPQKILLKPSTSARDGWLSEDTEVRALLSTKNGKYPSFCKDTHDTAQGLVKGHSQLLDLCLNVPGTLKLT